MAVTSLPEETQHTVGYSLASGVAVIELRWPAANNALDVTMRHGLLAAVRRVQSDGDAVRAVFLTAQGRNFSVGQELKEHARALEDHPASAFASIGNEYNPLVQILQSLPQPVVVAVEGACVGAGLGLALCADLRVAAEDASFATAFAGRGLAADTGLSASLTRAVGPSRAAALLLLGDQLEAGDALAWGLVHRVVASGRAGSEGFALARRLAKGPTVAFREVKSLLRGAGAPLDTVLEREALAQSVLGATRDHRDAVRALLSQRDPRFSGR
jgi:2-(1,2-epoxy-1,2-dihydrophenyl)acetyl-CoA isomerase